MDAIKQEDLWFNTVDTFSLCRGGGNGENHPSQLYAIKKYVKMESPYPWILDYGSGSGTTYEALEKEYGKNPNPFYYKGLDIIKKNVDWCINNFKGVLFQHNPSLHKIDEPDKSWDVVYSRHVVDHMRSFEEALDEHKRVARELVIVILWVPFSDKDTHEIKNIDYRPSGGKLYPDEYTNQYSRKLVKEYLTSDPEWELLELTEDVGAEVSGHDIVIVLRRKL